MTARALGLTLATAAFILLATANSGGYRYGVSDQSFYATAVVKDLHPDFFPRDSRLLSVESHLMWADEIVGGLVRTLHVAQPPVYLAIYLATLGLLFAGAIAFGRAAGLSWWAIAFLLLLLTFRHRIAKTGANSLEGYMHPRTLAFALGVLALAAGLVRREVWAIVGIAMAACWHPTTALWFGIVLAVALMTPRARQRPVAIALVLAISTLIAVWILWRGPLAGRLVVMDPAWLAALSEKDYLFPHEWPVYAWLLNLAYPLIILAIYRRRRRRGVLAPGEPFLVAGLIALALVFLISVPFTMLRIALAVQLQVTRVFWILDFFVAAYIAWWIVDDRLRDRRVGRNVAVGLLALASLARGTYLLSLDRQLFTPDLPRTPWIDAMTWLKAQPASSYVLADPTHTWKYGVSVRFAAEKDTLLEFGKDSALAIYDREVAMNVTERLEALRDFPDLTAPDLRRLAARYGLDVVVLEVSHPVDLPELYRNRQFVIYTLQ